MFGSRRGESCPASAAVMSGVCTALGQGNAASDGPHRWSRARVCWLESCDAARNIPRIDLSTREDGRGLSGEFFDWWEIGRGPGVLPERDPSFGRFPDLRRPYPNLPSDGVSHPGGLASAGRGLFVGTWLGALFGAFQNKVAELKLQAVAVDAARRKAEVGGRR